MSDAPISGNSSSSKTFLWMTIGLFIAVGGMVGGGLFMTNRLVRSVNLSTFSGNKEIVRTPLGNIRLQKPDQVGPGLLVYPHASMELPNEQSSANAIKDVQNGVNSAIYHTADSRDVVDAWYAAHLSKEFTRHDAGEKILSDIFRDARVADSDIAFSAERASQVSIVALTLEETGTKISLIHMGKASAASPAN